MATGRWTAIVVNYNGAGHLEACLAALSRSTMRPADALVVDNASTDDSLQELHGYPRVDVLRQPRNLGFAGGANAGLARVETDYALLLNPDVEVEPSFGAELVAAFDADPRLGAAGALLLYPDGRTVQHAGGVLEQPLLTTHHRGAGSTDLAAWTRPADVDYVTGGAMALRMTAVRAVGGFDERFTPVYYEDVDVCVRLRSQGWEVRYLPALRASHHEGVTLQRSAAYFHYVTANRLRFALKHLSPSVWSDIFVPAEIARLRHALATTKGVDWSYETGAAAIEEVARAPLAAADWSRLPGAPGGALTGLSDALAAARRTAPLPQPPQARGRVGRLLQVFSPRWRAWLDEALAQQRHANEALLAALSTQDQLNREQTALALTLALDLLNRVPPRDDHDEPPVEHRPAARPRSSQEP